MAPGSAGTALVSGRARFIGTRLGERLGGAGIDVVHVVDRAVDGVPDLGRLPHARLLQAVPAEPLPAIEPLDVVFHFAGPASPAHCRRFPVETLEAAGAATQRALALAHRHRARFVLVSTGDVYGDPLQYPQREGYRGNTDPVGPRGACEEAVRYAEALTMAWHRARGTEVGIARVFDTYGPRMPDDEGLIPRLLHQALEGGPLTLPGDGLQTRAVCYVDDTVDGLLALARSALSGPVNIGGDEELSLLGLTGLVKSVTGSRAPVVHTRRPRDEPRFRRPDLALASTRLGWRPRVRLEEGLRRTLDDLLRRRARCDGQGTARARLGSRT